MQMLHKSLLATTLSLAVSVFMFADISHAKKIKKAKPSSEVKVKVGAHLGPWDTSPEPNAEGEAKHEKESKKGVVKKDEFEGAVKVPVDAMSGLGIVDQATATNADIRMILSHADGTEFAECHLEFDGFDDHDDYNYVDYSRDEHNDDDDDDYGAQAEYKVEVALKVLRKKGVVLVKHGVCDINLTNADAAGNAVIDVGIPDAQAGDVAMAILVDPSEADKNPADRALDTEFLEGTFVIK